MEQMNDDVIDKLRLLLKKQPFMAIRLFTADGEEFWIPHSEWVLVPPVKRPRTVFIAEANGRVNHLNARMITNVQSYEGDPDEANIFA